MDKNSSRFRRALAAFAIIGVIVAAGALLWSTWPTASEASENTAAEVIQVAEAVNAADAKKVEWCVQTPENDCRPKACASDKHIIVLFTAKWCGYCKHLETKVLPDPEVQKLLKKFSLIVVDSEVNPKLVEESGVEGYPTFMIIHNDCEKMIDAFAGTPMTPKAFVEKFTPYLAH